MPRYGLPGGLARDGREHFALRALWRAQAPEFGGIEWTAAVGLKGALLQIEARLRPVAAGDA